MNESHKISLGFFLLFWFYGFPPVEISAHQYSPGKCARLIFLALDHLFPMIVDRRRLFGDKEIRFGRDYRTAKRINTCARTLTWNDRDAYRSIPCINENKTKVACIRVLSGPSTISLADDEDLFFDRRGRAGTFGIRNRSTAKRRIDVMLYIRERTPPIWPSLSRRLNVVIFWCVEK